MLNKKVIISLIKAIKAKGEKIENKIEDERLVKYVFNDISAVFSIKDGKETFFGMIFPLFGNDVLVSEDLELVSYNEELDDGLIIEDKKFLELVNQYLILRDKAITEFKY